MLTLAVIAATFPACARGQAEIAADHARATLEEWKAIGLACTGPTKDNVPSGLFQWSCRGQRHGVELSGVLDGDDRGVVSLQFVVDASTTPDAALDAFAGLVDATSQLDGHAAEIIAFIAGWPSIGTTGSFGPTRVRIDVDQIWRSIYVSVRPFDASTSPPIL
jgi:hypothetical protein